MTEQNEFTIVGRGSEAPIETAIREHLAADGWSVEDRPKATGVDILAHRDGRRLLIEVKGNTGSNSGLDVQTLYGQILERMVDPSDEFALGYPTAVRSKIDRVPARVQALLGLTFFEVDENGAVTRRDPS
ncbi:hypothetical protein DWB68_11665 [Galactobacter valiniphilus]|uniref:Protein NO VEIN C-terminal domain-containing protein n=1 Tax=Galactobacter valiniphilus TaxID=2676122 RepID=A0A399J946_9MICC|nr:DUF3883 domain-containing protein [Galactobacter valiniphilus]RII41600.1 hypothetical protein DWB68_11665 [Galactobacter valiniphilus]